jgi:phospholipase/lecithinase/hemolysin
MHKKLLVTGITLTACLLPCEARAASFTGLNIFGDSLVDSGNFFNATSPLVPVVFPQALPPTPPYNQRSTNGNLWIDNLADALGLSPTLVTTLIPTSSPPTEGINFAFFGALSSEVHNLDDDLQRAGLPALFPGFQDQLATFQSLTPIIPVDATALYTIWVGANDYIDVLFNELLLGPPLNGGFTESDIATFTNDVTNNIVKGVNTLVGLGAKEFLVVNLPPLGATPAADFLNQALMRDAASELNQLSEKHNLFLEQKLMALQANLPDTQINLLDVDSLIKRALKNPDTFGFKDVEESCLIDFSTGFNFKGVCDNPDEFLFWDDVHPTAAAHREISQLALATLEPETPPSSVPEPASVLGLLALGALAVGAKVSTQVRYWRA